MLQRFISILPALAQDLAGNTYQVFRQCEVTVIEEDIPGIYYLNQFLEPSRLPWGLVLNIRFPDQGTDQFRAELYTQTVNEMFEHLTYQDTIQPFMDEILGSEYLSNAAIHKLISLRFGKIVLFDPLDQEANVTAIVHGYMVTNGQHFTSEQLANIKRAGAIPVAGELFQKLVHYQNRPTISNTSPKIEQTIDFLARLGAEILELEITIVLEDSPDNNYFATYQQGGVLHLNVGRLGVEWFDLEFNLLSILDLAIHEFSHEYELNHYSGQYVDALSWVGAKTALWLQSNY